MNVKATEVGALVLFSEELEPVVEFYRAIGVPLEEERHDDGPLHYACELGSTHFAVYEGTMGAAPTRGAGGCAFAGFVVDSVADAVAAARAIRSAVLQEPEHFPWGLRAVLEDPDGRPVEVFERSPGPPAAS
jgi:predicted enzyme related to lactoylglutathione lyase